MQARNAETNGNYAAAQSNSRIALRFNMAAIFGWIALVVLIPVISVGEVLTATPAPTEVYYYYYYYHYYYYYK